MKKRILIVSPYLPFPLNSGGNIAQYRFLKDLKNDFEIYFIAPVSENNNSIKELELMLPEIYFFPFIDSLKVKIKRLIFKKSFFYLKRFLFNILSIFQNFNKNERTLIKKSSIFKSKLNYLDGDLLKHIESVILTNKIQILQVEFFEYIEIGRLINTNIQKIFVHHEIRHIREQREINLIHKNVYYLKNQYDKNYEFELNCLNQYNKIITLSDYDKYYLENLNLNNVYSSPIPFETSLSNEINENIDFSNNFSFLGGEDHFPNEEGLKWFINECWEEIKLNHPKSKLIIIGKWSQSTIDNFATDYSISFLGYVTDIKSILSDSIFVVPIRIGSGIRMKIIDAINYGAPVITTSIGVEGLEFREELDYLKADNKEMFLYQINRLVDNKELRSKLIKNSQMQLLKDYSTIKLIERRKNIYF